MNLWCFFKSTRVLLLCSVLIAISTAFGLSFRRTPKNGSKKSSLSKKVTVSRSLIEKDYPNEVEQELVPTSETTEYSGLEKEKTESVLKEGFKGDRTAGFASLKQEVPQQKLAVQGQIPNWLSGDVILTGPAVFDLGNSRGNYWFDGLAMLHKISFKPDAVVYQSKFLDSEHYRKSIKNNKFPEGFSTNSKSFFSRVASAFKKPDPYDNANVTICKIGSKTYAMTETPYWMEINPQDLSTKGRVSWQDSLDGHLTSAYPLYDPKSKVWYNYLTQFTSSTSMYHVCAMNEQCNRTVLASIPAPRPAYMRSFGMTDKYLIFTEVPLSVNPFNLLMASGSFIDNFEWLPKSGTIIHIVDKKSGKVTQHTVDPFFMLHHINAFEDKDAICFDIITYPDHNIIKTTLLERMRNPSPQLVPTSYLMRYTLDTKKKIISKKQLSSKTFEWPVINPAYAQQPYRYIFGLSALDQDLACQIVKIDLESDDTLHWLESGCYPGAPIFVAKPEAKKEDEGALISLVLDSNKKKSFILVLDAITLKEIGRAYLPCHVPCGARGIYS